MQGPPGRVARLREPILKLIDKTKNQYETKNKETDNAITIGP